MSRAVFTLLLCWALAAGPATAAPTVAPTPTLRLETGTHHAPIRAAGMDRDGRYVVTASEDKTARVWDAANGILLSVFRPPSGPGNDGKLYAVAMAPDGASFAAAGWSAGNDLYLVRRHDGRIDARIGGLPDVVNHLAFAPDGKTLVAGLGGAHGIRLFRAGQPWTELRGDADYGGAVHASAWAPDGKTLVVSSADGLLRCYDADTAGLRLRWRSGLADNGAPFGLAFSPDGRSVAVGNAVRASVVVLDAASGKATQLLTPAGASPGRSLSVVAWSADGQRIFAAGTWSDARGNFAICAWSAAGQARAALAAPARNTVTALQTGADGRLLYASADPGWGLLDPAGRELARVGHALPDFRGLRSRFRLAPDAGAVALRAAGAAFDTGQLSWVAPGPHWQAARDAAAGTVVDDWFERPRPALNGSVLNLDVNEISLSACVARDGQHAAIASNFKLRLYDRLGQLLWQAAAPATPWQVNCSDDGRWIVAAFSDGTVRWYARRDGSEQLALFAHADGRRWVMWTPAGYFAAGPGGEGLVGWQVERGPDQAGDFYPVSRFHDEYYRPERVSAVVAGGGGADAALAGTTAQPGGAAIRAQLPPTVRIVRPEARSVAAGANITLQVAVRAAPDAPLTGLRARINGQLLALPLATLKSWPDGAGRVYEVPLPLPPLDAQVLLFADNRHGASPEAPEATLTVKQTTLPGHAAGALLGALGGRGGIGGIGSGATSGADAGVDLRPVLYVLAIGVSDYLDQTIQLRFAAKDSTDLAAFLASQQGGLYRKVSVRLLTETGARRDDVLDGLEWIRREQTSRDVAIVFLAGHGVNDADGSYYFLPQDVDTRALKRTGVLFTEIRNTLISLPGKAMFFIDTCHAGNVLGTALRSPRLDTTGVINELSRADNGVIVFAATTGRQSAQESPAWSNGAFTKAILEGLRGRADPKKSGRITHKMLDLYVSERVKALTEGAQSPVTIVPFGVPDFPLVLERR